MRRSVPVAQMVATRLANLNLLDLHVIRGLEFDAVVVVDPEAILAQRADGGVGALYTALTRSTRALAIVHVDELPRILSQADGLLSLDGTEPRDPMGIASSRRGANAGTLVARDRSEGVEAAVDRGHRIDHVVAACVADQQVADRCRGRLCLVAPVGFQADVVGDRGSPERHCTRLRE